MTSIRPYFELKIPAPKYGAEHYCHFIIVVVGGGGIETSLVCNTSWSGHVNWIM
jgi:hypothetical protein